MSTSDPRAPASRASAGTEALRRLREGNARVPRNVRSVDALLGEAGRRSLLHAKAPLAIVLSSSDSRAPAELVEHQGLGALVVVRAAGDVVAPSLVGSVGLAGASFGTELVIVMGTSHRGGIAATVDGMLMRSTHSEHVRDIVDRLRPAIDGLVRSALPTRGFDREAPLRNERALPEVAALVGDAEAAHADG